MLGTTRELLESYEAYKNNMLLVTYETLGDYLWFLKGISQEIAKQGSKVMLYLAAAVSDFYVPKEDMVLKQ